MGDLVLVTGGTGYIATYCIKLLLERGFKVRTTVRDASSEKVDVLREGCGVPGMAGAIEIFEALLSESEGWAEACVGCKYVMHTASPVGEFLLPLGTGPTEEGANRLIEEAVLGTKNVFNAVVSCGDCKRIVQTSSSVTISPTKDLLLADYPRTADSYSDPKDAIPYMKSKILAEQAAWEIANEAGLAMASILPTFVVGPCLSKLSRSASLRKFDDWFLQDGQTRSTYPVCDTPMVDVRDVALAHVEAMLREAAASQRFVLHHVAVLPRDVLEVWRSDGYSHVPAETKIPLLDSALSTLAMCSSSAQKWKRFVNRNIDMYDATASRQILGIEYTDVEITARDYAESCEKFSILAKEFQLGRE